jgi:phage terminase small subunit
MGAPRKPTALLVLNGSAKHNPGRMAARVNEPVITGPIGDAPEYLDEYARGKWAEITSDPDYSMVLNSGHREALDHYCLLYSRYRQDIEGTRQMTASERQTYHSLAMQLGRTPAAQSKVQTPPKPKPKTVWEEIG